MTQTNASDPRTAERAALLRRRDESFAHWAAGYGPIRHGEEIQVRIHEMVSLLAQRGLRGDALPPYELLAALDRVTSAAMWLVVHQTYARNVYFDGRPLMSEDFKPHPEGHTGGALNMAPAYAGYMAVNALTGITRAWVMGQGHTVAAIDSINLLLDNMTPAHSERYSLSDEGLSRYVRDFYSYRIGPDGKQDSPLGSHVNPHTAGGISEGGYLGFTELEYVHMPLPGERLVTFLSDGAFEEQRGSDWAPRWWRAEDSGLVAPIMIYNGRRIDQRTTTTMQGGVDWFVRHLELNGFDPIVFDGRDPAAFLWAILEMEERLQAAAGMVREGRARYPVRLPYGIAATVKGAGFYGEGTNAAHNLPLGTNPHADARAAHNFNESARRLWVFPGELQPSIRAFQHHEISGRVKERNHPLAARNVLLERLPPPPQFRPVPQERKNPVHWTHSSPMAAVDQGFVATVTANPGLRPRVGNPDELASNRMLETLRRLKHRVTDPEPGASEAIDGAIITALNEEAVAGAALGNKGGINIVVSYEAFAAKMYGVFRQEVIFADHLTAVGRPPGWLSIPLLLTSNTYENSKNERSHQDPSMAEAMVLEPSDISRVIFPADYNSAAVAIRAVYLSRGQLWSMVTPKADVVPDLFTSHEAEQLMQSGALALDWAGHEFDRPRVILTAVGAYQLGEVLKASWRLAARGLAHRTIYIIEPGRFRRPRTSREAAHMAPQSLRDALYPASVRPRVWLSHTRPEVLTGLVSPLHTGECTVGLGFIDQGGTLSINGMLFVNRSSWAHVVEAAAKVLDIPREELIEENERAVLDGHASPHDVIFAGL